MFLLELYTDLTFRTVEMYRWKKIKKKTTSGVKGQLIFFLEIIMYHRDKTVFFPNGMAIIFYSTFPVY